ncbi:hypothetical protein T4E_3950, partial [Trichinella pseudospiralis]
LKYGFIKRKFDVIGSIICIHFYSSIILLLDSMDFSPDLHLLYQRFLTAQVTVYAYKRRIDDLYRRLLNHLQNENAEAASSTIAELSMIISCLRREIHREQQEVSDIIQSILNNNRSLDAPD